jgi:hypothetical protein
MDMGKLNFALKLIQDEFKLSEDQIQILQRRMLADDKEFEKVWQLYKNQKKKFLILIILI